VYVYADTHRYARENLKYFVRTAVRANDHVHYYFILQRVGNISVNNSHFPTLPSNAWYVHHENKCFDIGTVGWFLRTHFVGTFDTNVSSLKIHKSNNRDIKSYKYFIFMNSSIRGPFYPPYYFTILETYQNQYQNKFYWYSIFTQKLNHKVKLVGCTINCQISPHVQSYLLVTDLQGLLLLLRPERGHDVFGCYKTLWSVTLNSEIAASTRILDNGFWIDSLQTKYQELDFSRKENRKCNREINPYFDKSVDGLTLDPYEVVFVKYNHKDCKEAAERAAVYQQWSSNFNFST
jgi:hypothetical protein